MHNNENKQLNQGAERRAGILGRKAAKRASGHRVYQNLVYRKDPEGAFVKK